MNGWDLLLAALLLGIVFLALRRIRKSRREGGACCGDCSSCGAGCAAAKGKTK